MSFSPVNVDDALLSTWISEGLDSLSDEPLDSECQFFNFSRAYTATFCSPFSISRIQTGTVRVATDRALRCAAKHGLECVLSGEVGFAVPAAFVAQHGATETMKAIVAPRLLSSRAAAAKQEYVRVSVPRSTFAAHTVQLNDTVTVEYLTATKRLETATLRGEEAFCLQLLRRAYEPACWSELDGV
jgi:hypothetical protein